MIELEAEQAVDMLEQRLRKGADLLFDMELRCEMADEYHRWLAHWSELLGEYEALQAA